jgi:thiamine-phosphate pyrophosphorylase
VSGAAEGPTEAGCRLYLISPQDLDPEGFAPDLEAALGATDGVAFLLRPAPSMTQKWRKNAPLLQQICATFALAFLIQDDVDLALAIGADGVHLADPSGVRAARARLGAERILGASCGHSRHAAMLAGDDGADYIAFGEADRAAGPPLVELVTWWHELFVLPSLAEGALDAAGCARAARAGADFVGVRDAVWQHPDGPAAGVRAIREAIAGA